MVQPVGKSSRNLYETTDKCLLWKHIYMCKYLYSGRCTLDSRSSSPGGGPPSPAPAAGTCPTSRDCEDCAKVWRKGLGVLLSLVWQSLWHDGPGPFAAHAKELLTAREIRPVWPAHRVYVVDPDVVQSGVICIFGRTEINLITTITTFNDLKFLMIMY